ncbi:hypothetical protein Fmac_017844 [Flemingia macrophylla]|uniref:Uncharacterized protein n=1 Tax=Flemingia macrophylla TaxID=520843 RepID=A0ABD1M388_9FABA
MNHYMSLLGSWYCFETLGLFILAKVIYFVQEIMAFSFFLTIFFDPQVGFLLRSGREYDQASTDSDKLSPRFLGYFLFRSSERNQSFDKSSSFKEQSAHVTSVRNILENHASYLMSGKELSKLVAFVKGTQSA